MASTPAVIMTAPPTKVRRKASLSSVILLRRLVRKRREPGSRAGSLNAASLALVIVIGCLINSLADNTILDTPTAYAAALIVVAVLSSPGVELRRAPTVQAA